MSNILTVRPAAQTVSESGPRRSRRPLSDKTTPYLFVSPFLILFAVFGVWQIVRSLILAFYATNGPKSQVFFGLNNF
ncbi:MAG: L-arabinose transport system permease protein AraP, partial [Capsulimonas sp.]|nr:L-arabinose transport system permease protein AraP [Capsulimonas sp.]